MSYFKVYRPRSQALRKHTIADFCFPSMALSFHGAQVSGQSSQLRYLQRAAADIPVSNRADQPWQAVRVSLVAYGTTDNFTNSFEPWPAFSGSNTSVSFKTCLLLVQYKRRRLCIAIGHVISCFGSSTSIKGCGVSSGTGLWVGDRLPSSIPRHRHTG